MGAEFLDGNARSVILVHVPEEKAIHLSVSRPLHISGQKRLHAALKSKGTAANKQTYVIGNSVPPVYMY